MMIDTSGWTARDALDFVGLRTVAADYAREGQAVKEAYEILSKFLKENGQDETEWS